MAAPKSQRTREPRYGEFCKECATLRLSSRTKYEVHQFADRRPQTCDACGRRRILMILAKRGWMARMDARLANEKDEALRTSAP